MGSVLAWLKRWLTNSWMSDVTYLAAMAHVGWACLIVLAAHVIRPSLTLHVALGVGLFALAKEYVYDANFERPKQTFRDNTQDFFGYIGGLLLAALIFAIAHRFH